MRTANGSFLSDGLMHPARSAGRQRLVGRRRARKQPVRRRRDRCGRGRTRRAHGRGLLQLAKGGERNAVRKSGLLGRRQMCPDLFREHLDRASRYAAAADALVSVKLTPGAAV